MERSKLKLTVIFLLAVLNLFLLGSVLLQHHQSQVYADTTREQVLLYLQRSGVTVQEETIPWQSTLSTQLEEAAGQLLPGQDVPQQGLPAHCEIQPARETATLLVARHAREGQHVVLQHQTAQIVGSENGQDDLGRARPHLGNGHQHLKGLAFLKTGEAEQLQGVLAHGKARVQGQLFAPVGQGRQRMGGQGHFIAHAPFSDDEAGIAPGFGQAAFKIGDHTTLWLCGTGQTRLNSLISANVIGAAGL